MCRWPMERIAPLLSQNLGAKLRLGVRRNGMSGKRILSCHRVLHVMRMLSALYATARRINNYYRRKKEDTHTQRKNLFYAVACVHTHTHTHKHTYNQKDSETVTVEVDREAPASPHNIHQGPYMHKKCTFLCTRNSYHGRLDTKNSSSAHSPWSIHNTYTHSRKC
jgi:hypothetical protein